MDENAIASVRRFNRFFTRFVGALNSNFLDSGMTLAEAPILFELATAAQPCFADSVQRNLNLDASFVSRVLTRFGRRGWIQRVRYSAYHTKRDRPTNLNLNRMARVVEGTRRVILSLAN